MKTSRLTTLALAGILATSQAEPPAVTPPTEAEKIEALKTHQEGSEKAAIDQDKQAANAAELVDEQTLPQVIELLRKVESLMGEATDRLEEGNTGGDTIAIQNEITEMIYEAAKAKSQPSPGEPQNKPGMGAMLEMMEQMLGKGESVKPQDLPSEQGGTGIPENDSDSTNEPTEGASNTNQSERRVPRAAGKSGAGLPREFQKALEGYNKISPAP